MIALIWHVFLTVWVTGCVAGGYAAWRRLPTQQLKREVEAQGLQTRKAELQARERKALDVGH